MLIGINHHPIGSSVTALELKRFDLVRYPVWQSPTRAKNVRTYRMFGRECASLGTMPIIVLDKNTIGDVEAAWKANIEKISRQYYNIMYYQVGNEPDQPDSDSSWYMEPSRYRELLHIASEVLGADKLLIGAGLVSGNPHYLEQLAYFPFHKLAVHPYGQFPTRKNPMWNDWGFGDVCDLLDLYVNVMGESWRDKIWVTEFGMPTGAFDSKEQRQQYYEDMLVEMSDWGVGAALSYCWTPEQCGDLSIKGSVEI